MRTVRTVAALRAALAPERAAGRRIALVPTMGALHEGHLSLVRRARATSDVVVVSLFVNPTQFEDPDDLAAYPRGAARDAALAAAAGADLLFAPEAGEVYPEGFATTVRVRGPLTESLEGARRGPGHFDGVATVVAKLLGMCRPDVAWFGQKDAQQVLVVRRLVADLDLPVEIAAGPTIRDPDGLALSSRNARLAPGQRERALGLSRALRSAAAGIADGALPTGAAVRRHGLGILRDHGAEPEYFEAVDPGTLAPVGVVGGDVLLVCAARVGDVRLIDNLPVSIPTPAPSAAAMTPAGAATAAS